jgi:hypothetical protein
MPDDDRSDLCPPILDGVNSPVFAPSEQRRHWHGYYIVMFTGLVTKPFFSRCRIQIVQQPQRRSLYTVTTWSSAALARGAKKAAAERSTARRVGLVFKSFGLDLITLHSETVRTRTARPYRRQGRQDTELTSPSHYHRLRGVTCRRSADRRDRHVASWYSRPSPRCHPIGDLTRLFSLTLLVSQ